MIRRVGLVVLLSMSSLTSLNSCNSVSDDSIATEIKAKMFSEPLLKSATVNISSKDGIVTITGIVPDDAARQAAERIASQTKGVKQIIDSTTVAAAVPQAPPQAAATFAPPPAPEPAPVSKPPRKKEKRSTAAPAPPPVPEPDNSAASAAAAPTPAPGPVTPAVDSTPTPPPAPAAPPPPQPITVTIPEGTVVSVRTIDAIDSKTSSTGDYFQASLDAPVRAGDQVVFPRGLNVKLKLVQASSAGKFAGRSELTVSLDSIAYQGKNYVLSTSDVQQKGASRGKRSGEVIGGGSVLGAIIGGIAGGGKGAAIGAAAGAGAGAGVQAMTHGQQVKIPAETKLDFTLHSSVDVVYIPAKKVARPAPSQADESAPQQQ